MKPRITTGFDPMSDPDFETKAGSIYNGVNGNAFFPTPTPTMPEVNDALQGYSVSLLSAQTRDKNAVAAKNQARAALTDLLTQLASYVTMTANGDRAILVASNYDLASEGDSTPITKPENIQLSDGANSGEIVVKVKGVKGAKSYLHQYTADPLTASSEWTQVISTTSKYTFKNLSVAQRVWCRVAAVGSYNQVVFSDAVSRVVQ
jgi:hypothetical protein